MERTVATGLPPTKPLIAVEPNMLRKYVIGIGNSVKSAIDIIGVVGHLLALIPNSSPERISGAISSVMKTPGLLQTLATLNFKQLFAMICRFIPSACADTSFLKFGHKMLPKILDIVVSADSLLHVILGRHIALFQGEPFKNDADIDAHPGVRATATRIAEIAVEVMQAIREIIAYTGEGIVVSNEPCIGEMACPVGAGAAAENPEQQPKCAERVKKAKKCILKEKHADLKGLLDILDLITDILVYARDRDLTLICNIIPVILTISKSYTEGALYRDREAASMMNDDWVMEDNGDEEYVHIGPRPPPPPPPHSNVSQRPASMLGFMRSPFSGSIGGTRRRPRRRRTRARHRPRTRTARSRRLRVNRR
jgi:hypothetical protein